MLEIRRIYSSKQCRRGIHLLWCKDSFGKLVADVMISVPTNTMVDENGNPISERVIQEGY